MTNLKAYREKAGLTQKQLAESAGINVLSYHRYEYGKRYPDVMTAVRIADVLKVGNLRELWDGHPIHS